MSRFPGLFKRPLASPFLLTSGLYMVMLYYLSAYLSMRLAAVSFVIFSLFALLYGMLAWLLKLLFRRMLGSVSLKLTAFFLTTAILPILMLVLLTFMYLLFLVGLNESYMFMRVIRYEYMQATGENGEHLAFDASGDKLLFKGSDGGGREIEATFFDRVHQLTGTDFSVAVVRLNDLNEKESGSGERGGKEAGPHPGLVMPEDPNALQEEGTSPLYVKVYSSRPDMERKMNTAFTLSYPFLQYPIVFPLEQGEWSDNVLFLIRVDLREFWQNLFGGESSFASVNRGVLTVLGGLSLSFLIFELYLLLKGMIFAVSISGSTRNLVHAAGELKAGRFDTRVEELPDRNLQAVGESLNAMAANIQVLFQEKLEREQMAQELEIARRIQSSVLLDGVFQEGDCRIAVHSRPSRVVGGDYCNYFRRGDELEILAGDVSGKGLGAAMYVSEVDGLFYGMASRGQPQEAIVEGLHRFFLDRGGGTTFFSATLLDICTREGRIHYYRLGDPPLAVCNREGGWRMLRPRGMIAGMRGVGRLLPYLEKTTLALADVCGVFLYSDGFEELAGRAGISVLDVLAGLNLGDFRACHEELSRTVAAWAGTTELHDDVTFALISLVDVSGGCIPEHA